MTVRQRLRVWYIISLAMCTVIICAHAYREMRRDPTVYNIERSREIGIFSLGLALPMALLALWGGWWLSRRSLDQLQAITDAAARTEADNLVELIPRSGNGDEFDRLTLVFNDMRQRLQTSFLQVREFTLAASHELKTPLTIIRADIETALQGAIPIADEQRPWLENLVDEIDRLAHIVDQLAFLSKADAGIVKVEMKPVNLSSLVEDATDDAHTLASTNQIQVETSIAPDVMVLGDPLRLRQLLLNLIDNSVKHNVPKGLLRIELQQTQEAILLTISNTAMPLPPAQQTKVFERFFRGNHGLENSPEGTGLGLNIARWVVESHHGTIQFHSASDGLTTLTITLPRIEQSPPRTDHHFMGNSSQPR
jgi:signal transduction histidine kinase